MFKSMNKWYMVLIAFILMAIGGFLAFQYKLTSLAIIITYVGAYICHLVRIKDMEEYDKDNNQ